MPHLHLIDLSFTWPEGGTVLENISLSLGPGRHGLIGHNGAGKTTLLRLLSGELQPTSGSVVIDGDLAVLPQHLPDVATGTIGELLGVGETLAALDRIAAGSVDPDDFDTVGDDWDVAERLEAELARLGLPDLDLARPASSLSGGELTLAALAALLWRRPDVLILDEPTNNLDARARSLVHGALSGFTGVVLVVSHERDWLEDMDTIVEVRRGAVRTCAGGLSEFEAMVAAEQEAASQAVTTAQADVRRQRRELAESQTKQARRDRHGRTHGRDIPKIIANEYKRRAQATAGRVRGMHEDRLRDSTDRLEDAKSRVRDDIEIRIDLPETAVPPSRKVFNASELRSTHGRMQLDLDLRGPERVAITGPNGAGKTSLLRVITGLDESAGGSVQIHVPWRHLPQDLKVLDMELSVFDNVRQIAPAADPNTIRSQLARFGFRGRQADASASTLSGGQRWRATLACLLLAEPAPQLLILDEPTNHVDLDGQQQLIDALSAHRGALIVVSHDESFLDQIGARRLNLDVTPGPGPSAGRGSAGIPNRQQ